MGGVLEQQRQQQIAYFELIASDIEQLNSVLKQNLQSDVGLIEQVSSHLIFAGGKRLRPLLMLLICRALGYQGSKQYNLAAVVELIHTSTLLHDDVVDESSLRRGKPTANNIFGNSASVLVGDFLYSRSFQMMVQANSMRIMHILADATNTIAAGEVQQLINTHNADITVAEYQQVIQDKTAKLFAASALIGAIVSGASQEIEQGCANYGKFLGTAFQIIDDTLDYEGDASTLGKNLGDDLREGKITLPLILALQKVDVGQQQHIRAIIQRGGSEIDLPQVCQLISSTNSIAAAKQIALDYAKQAIAALAVLPESIYKNTLLDLADELLQRHN